MKDRLLYELFRVAALLFGLLPEPAVRRLGRGLGILSYHAARGRRELAARNLRRVIGDEATPAAVREMFASYGRYWAEVFWMRPKRLPWVQANSTEVDKWIYDDALASGKGVIFALAHTGNFEMSGARSTQEGTRVLAVAEALSNRLIMEWFLKVRNDMAVDVAIAGPGTNVTRALMRRLKEGGGIGLMSDRDISGNGIEVEFFGEKTTLPAGPAVLADRTGAYLIPLGTYFKDGPGHWFKVFPPVEMPAGETVEERVAAGTQALAHAMEELIREAPIQWHIMQPNWPADREGR